MDKQKYKLTILYDGTHFGGWQIQPNTPTIQEELQKALKILLKSDISVIGAGRTDAGVHALGQVAHFSTDKSVDIQKALRSLNGILSKDIRIKTIEPVSSSFHSRFSAKGKIYHYYLHQGSIHSPFKRLYSHLVNEPLDIELLKKASQYFVGKRNFKAFANKNSMGAAAKNSVRTITSIEVTEEGDNIRLEFAGDGFLYKMIRNIVGTLLDVCKEKILLNDIEEIFISKDRQRAGNAISPRGLFLVKIFY